MIQLNIKLSLRIHGTAPDEKHRKRCLPNASFFNLCSSTFDVDCAKLIKSGMSFCNRVCLFTGTLCKSTIFALFFCQFFALLCQAYMFFVSCFVDFLQMLFESTSVGPHHSKQWMFLVIYLCYFWIKYITTGFTAGDSCFF